MTDNAKNYHEKMFPGYVSDFLRTDPEFIEAFDNFLVTVEPKPEDTPIYYNTHYGQEFN